MYRRRTSFLLFQRLAEERVAPHFLPKLHRISLGFKKPTVRVCLRLDGEKKHLKI